MTAHVAIFRCGLITLFAVVSVTGRAQEGMPACSWQGSHQWLSTRASPLDSAVLETPDLTVKVCYSRPSARGRPVFDSLAPLGKVWRTGANEPTMLRLSAKATVGGVDLTAGCYVLMTVPRKQSWAILFFTTEAADPAAMFQTLKEVGQGVAAVERLDKPMESFTIRVDTTATGAELFLEWDVVRVRVPIVPRRPNAGNFFSLHSRLLSSWLSCRFSTSTLCSTH